MSQQHGFTRERSCLTNLLTSLNDWTSSLDGSIGTDVIYLDFHKAFNTVPSKQCRVLQQLSVPLSSYIPKDSFTILYETYIHPHVEHCIQAWNPYYAKDIQKTQHHATKFVPELSNLSYEERLKESNLYSLYCRRRGDLIDI